MKSFIVVFLLIPFINLAQISVTNSVPYDNPQTLVEDVLLGNGVTASNITFSGDAAQIGFFNGVNSNIGLDSGIVMSSAAISTIVPGGTGTDDFMSSTNDADLIAVAQSVTTNPSSSNINSTNDLADLNFDFTVVGDTVQFEFVFGSDEYTTWINSQYNDVFSFFLSGPGINGPYASPSGFPNGAVNVALIPGTTDPITISSVQPGLNSQYYIDNASNTTVGLNGFTTVITAKYPVICGETYHFRFAIADCQDGSLGSAVFLKANSLGSSGKSVTSFANFAGVQGDLIGERCGEAGFVFSVSDTSVADTIRFEILGNAQMNEDYSFFPDSIILPQGVSTDTIWVEIYQDNTIEGIDTIQIRLLDVQGCNLTSLYIQSIEPMFGTLSVDSVNICPPELAELTASVTGGLEPYSISWDNNGGYGDTVYVSPLTTTTYNVSVMDKCGSLLDIESSIVWVQCPVEPANVFTPNGDGDNDLYKAINLEDYPNASIIIYNRWGKIVYEMDDYQNDWNGTHYKTGAKLKEGVYFYIITPNSPKYEYTENKDLEKKRTLTGFVQLMR